jgi:hypothetical protein
MNPELIKQAYWSGARRALEDLGASEEEAKEAAVQLTEQKEDDLRDANASQD